MILATATSPLVVGLVLLLATSVLGLMGWSLKQLLALTVEVRALQGQNIRHDNELDDHEARLRIIEQLRVIQETLSQQARNAEQVARSLQEREDLVDRRWHNDHPNERD